MSPDLIISKLRDSSMIEYTNLKEQICGKHAAVLLFLTATVIHQMPWTFQTDSWQKETIIHLMTAANSPRSSIHIHNRQQGKCT
eukprot:scaffold40359_cov17-Prasinocladus_malaysianus.AAC.1